jgi:hypothetical protein
MNVSAAKSIESNIQAVAMIAKSRPWCLVIGKRSRRADICAASIGLDDASDRPGAAGNSAMTETSGVGGVVVTHGGARVA